MLRQASRQVSSQVGPEHPCPQTTVENQKGHLLKGFTMAFVGRCKQRWFSPHARRMCTPRTSTVVHPRGPPYKLLSLELQHLGGGPLP